MSDIPLASVLLEEQVDDRQTVLPIKVDILYENGQLFIKVPEVLTYGDYPGDAVPILLELADGKLKLRVYDDQSDDPALTVTWERALWKPAALADAKEMWKRENEQDYSPVTPSTMSVGHR